MHRTVDSPTSVSPSRLIIITITLLLIINNSRIYTVRETNVIELGGVLEHHNCRATTPDTQRGKDLVKDPLR